ncbi:hypothetical protein Ae717Ps2_6839 [Pseudonocardia sp. Ae717_Ps2]|nr:hypothetical protein Ae717Ps2_6839 [Pseudonocardia sp. Ae717_Ps2]
MVAPWRSKGSDDWSEPVLRLQSSESIRPRLWRWAKAGVVEPSCAPPEVI